MDTQQALPALEATSSPFGVILSWRWPEGARQGDRVEVQHLAAGAVLCRSKFIEWPEPHTTIGGLAAGQKVQVRARLVDKSGKSNDWKASDWIMPQRFWSFCKETLLSLSPSVVADTHFFMMASQRLRVKTFRYPS